MASPAENISKEIVFKNNHLFFQPKDAIKRHEFGRISGEIAIH
jgi:hypothetical protein